MSEAIKEVETGEGFSGPCWCGERNGWCSTIDLDSSCGGLGTLYCYCGGDLCVCHNHGEVDCYGCEDCEGDDGDDDYYPEDDYE